MREPGRLLPAIQRVIPAFLVLGLLACGEPTPTRPSRTPAPSASKGPADPAALEARINGLINALFAPKDQGDFFKAFARIKSQIASGRTTDAQASIVAFVKTLLDAQQGGGLQDPNGAQPPTIADALRDLVNSVSQFGGLPPPLPASNPFAGDGAVAVVGPAGGTVVSSSGFGGVGIPAGALPADVIMVVARLPNPVTPGAGPLPTTLTQYPLFYDFSTTPAVAQFAVPVTVGICQLEVGEPFAPPTQAVADRLQLAHPNPASPATVQLLERTPAGFIHCNGITLSAAGLEAPDRSLGARALGLLAAGGSRVWSLLRPSVAYAVHGGLGGKTTSFSPFAAVDPGLMTVGVCPTPMSGVLATYPTVDIAIANSAPGGDIRICPQTINVPATYLVDKPLTIEGDNPANPPQFLVNGATTPIGFRVNPVLQGLVTFRSLVFTLSNGASSAIDAGTGSPAASWWQVVVENSQFTLPAGQGAAVRVFQTSVPNPKVTIQNNQLSRGTIPIQTLTSSPTSTIEVLSNTFGGGSLASVVVQNEAAARVEGNTFTGGCGLGCITIVNVANGVVRNNTLTFPASFNSPYGILVTFNPATPPITTSVIGNSIVGTGGGGLPSDPLSYAIDAAAIFVGDLVGTNGVHSTTVTVSGNTISNAAAGIRASGGGVTITGANNVISNVLAGLRLDNTSPAASSLTIASSDFTSYFTPITFTGPSVPLSTLVATCNWWGSAAGPQNITPGTLISMLSPFATAPVANGAGGQCNGTITEWIQVGAGGNYSCGLRVDGAAFCWGGNGAGQLGDGTQNSHLIPAPVSGGHTFAALAVGNVNACGLTSAGSLYCWGSNPNGELGAGLPVGAGQFSAVPVLVSGGLTFASVSMGLSYSCGITTGAVTYCWGANQHGQLGSGAVGVGTNVPAAVINSATLGFQRVSTGFFATCALTNASALYCWGESSSFGNGAASGMTTTPTPAGNGVSFQQVTEGDGVLCGLAASGVAFCWSRSNAGQSGTGGTAFLTVPTAVAGGLLFQMLDGNSNNTVNEHTCGVTQSGQAYCWGNNDQSQLGATAASTCTFSGTYNCSLTPIAVSGGIQFSTVALGNSHTCGLGVDHAIYCWGSNASGQLGDGTTTNRAAPVRVSNP